jgi:glycosyltransferase involved in cell wall biosynthesis
MSFIVASPIRAPVESPLIADPPRVTILMPVYNGEPYLDEAIASVIAQDFQDFELLIVDDGSTDATPGILARWAAREQRIVLVTRRRNGGIPVALNAGLEVARGEYIARHDADDVVAAGRVRAQVEALEADPEVSLVSCRHHAIDARGRRLYTTPHGEDPEVTAHLLHFSNAVGGHGQVMFRRDVVRSLGGYHEDFGPSEDYELWTRLARRGPIVSLPMIGMSHRLHAARASIVHGARQRDRSLRTSRRMLGELLGRELGDDEVAAVASAWRVECRPGSAALAHRVLLEAYRRFVATNADRHHRRRVRVLTARRWVLGAALHARRGHPVEAARRLGYAARWHPFGLLAGIGGGVCAVGRRLRRRRVAWVPSH